MTTVRTVQASTRDTELLPDLVDGARLGAIIYNNSNITMYIKLGTEAAIDDFSFPLAAHGYWEVPFGYSGPVNAIWSGSNGGNAKVTEILR